MSVSGSVWCFGLGSQGRLGQGFQTGNVYSPSDIPAVKLDGISGKAISVTVGDRHSCALMASGEVRCWGGGQYIGLGSDSNVLDPSLVDSVAFGPAKSFMHLTCGEVIMCVSSTVLPASPTAIRTTDQEGSFRLDAPPLVAASLPSPALWLASSRLRSIPLSASVM